MKELLIGNVKGPTGTTWYSGTGITGTSTTETVYPSSGITAAMVDDYYINFSESDHVYVCTLSGNAATAKWKYVGTLLPGYSLTFDTTPTSGSKNPVTSGGIFLSEQALQTLIGNNTENITKNSNSIAAIKNEVTATEYQESTTTASRAYSEGDIVNVNGTLYVVTSTIASGGTFTPGTNCIATTLGKSISNETKSREDADAAETSRAKTAETAATSILHKATVPYANFALNSTTVLYECTVTISGITADTDFGAVTLDSSCVDTAAMVAAWRLFTLWETGSGTVKFSAVSKPASDIIVDCWEVK
jgi:hypothetical protein